MITIVGTGHVFNISESMMFIVKQIWPQAVLVELDEYRFKAMTQVELGGDHKVPEYTQDDLPWIYRRTAEYQNKIAKKNRTGAGGELATAALTGRLIEAEIGLIDLDVVKQTKEMWEEMSFLERTRYVLSTYLDRIGGKRRADRTARYLSEDEDKAIAAMYRRYPVMMRKLHDERNRHMVGEILRYAEKYDNIVVVVGDAHVKAIASMLGDREIRIIRYGDIVDKARFDKIRKELWNE